MHVNKPLKVRLRYSEDGKLDFSLYQILRRKEKGILVNETTVFNSSFVIVLADWMPFNHDLR